MKHFTSTIIIFSILAIGLFSCTETKERTQLQRIEKMMDGNPDADSAMMLLQGISPKCLSSEADRAYYALLFSQAKDKTDETVTDDSLISIAVKYYSRGNDTYYNMLSQYYLGRIKFNAEDYPQSIVAMFKALDCATELDNKFWMGMICRALADVYNETYNSAEELIYAEKEYQYFTESGRQPYVNYALLDMARALGNKGDYDKAVSVSMQCVDSAMKYKDKFLYVDAKRSIGLAYFAQERYSNVLPIYKEICESDFGEPDDSMYLSLSYIEYGDIPHAVEVLNSLLPQNNSLNYYSKYRIYLQMDSLRPALKAIEEEYNQVNNIFRKRIGMNITSSVVDYFKLSKEVAEVKSEKAHVLLWLILVCTFSILLIVVFFVYSYRKKQLAKIEQNVIVAEQLRETLVIREEQYTEICNSVKDLLSSKYEIFDEMCRLVYESNNSTAARKRISDSVTSLIKQMQNDSNMIKEMEKFVDTHCLKLMSDLRTALPDMPIVYYKLFLFSVLGFSDIAITIFLEKDKVSQIYNIRRHLKDKIKGLGEKKSCRFMDYL